MRGSGFRASLTIGSGVVAATALGKVAPASGDVRDAFGLSPFALGAVISVIASVTALLATPAGRWLSGRDTRRWLVVGLVAMGVAGGAMSLSAPHVGVLVGLRLAEGVGYLLVTVGGPVVLLAQVPVARHALALALWGACIPAGLAVGAGVGGVLSAAVGWRDWFAVLALTCLLLAAAVSAATRPAPPEPPRPVRWRHLVAGPLPLACGFSAVALIGVAVLSLLPTYLHVQDRLSTTQAGAVTSAVAAASILGSTGAGLLLHHGIRPGALAASALLCPGFTWAVFAPSLAVAMQVGAAVALLLTVGIAVAAAYGALPQVAPGADRLAVANGLVVQLGSAGTLVAPPVFAAVTGLHSWTLTGYLAAAAAITGVLLLLYATRRRPPGRTSERSYDNAAAVPGAAADEEGP